MNGGAGLASDCRLAGGGKAGNVAYLARCLGVPAQLVARIGDDPMVEHVLVPLRGAGVDLSEVRTAPCCIPSASCPPRRSPDARTTPATTRRRRGSCSSPGTTCPTASTRPSPTSPRSTPRATPAYIVTCGFDPLRDTGHEYARLLAEAGGRVTYIHHEGLTHGFIQFTEKLRRFLEATREIGRDFGRALRGEPIGVA